MAKKIFIAATMQNDGKTTVSLGLIAALKKHFPRIGFIKPIGQRYLLEQGYKVDEDSVLIEEVFGIRCNIKDMSPVAIEKGFTERYIERSSSKDYSRRILKAFDRVASCSDLVIIEGTGHAGVGSVFDLSNATVAKLLGANVLLISSGGVGKPIDEVMLNKALFDKEGVKVGGIIVNKVLPEKYDRISRLVRMGLQQKGLDVFGIFPYQRILDMPTMREIGEELKIDALLSGDTLDVPLQKILVGAMKIREALTFIENDCLMIIPGDRDDMIEAMCHVCTAKSRKQCRIAGMIISGGFMPRKRTLALLKKSRISTLITPEDTYAIVSRVGSLVVKLKPQDTQKIKVIVDMVEHYIDVEKILSQLR